MQFDPGALFPVDAKALKRAGFREQFFALTDRDFGFVAPPEVQQGRQFSVRVILFDETGRICVVKSLKNGYIQVPGGGVEPGETLEMAAKRETREETGIELTDLKPLGYGTELMFGGLERWVYVFEAKAARFLGTQYTPDEKEEEFEPSWMPMDMAEGILEMKEQEFRVAPPEQRSYRGSFANRRDLMILQDYPTAVDRGESHRKYQIALIAGIVATVLVALILIGVVVGMVLPVVQG